MKFTGAVVKEQGVRFAVVLVKSHILQNQAQAQETARGFNSFFPGTPIVLAAQQSGGRMKYLGRNDIVRFLSKVPYTSIPWREYKVS